MNEGIIGNKPLIVVIILIIITVLIICLWR